MAIQANLKWFQKIILFDAHEEIDTELLDHLLTATKIEISRLQGHSELFLSECLEEDFWEEVYDLSNDLLGVFISNLEACDTEEQEFHDVSMEMIEDLRLPARDAQRKPWEQFLHNGAPGSGADVSEFGNDGSVQILPLPGYLIMMNMNREHESIIRDIKAVSHTLCTKSSG